MSSGSTVRPESTLAVASKSGPLALQHEGDPDKWYDASDHQMIAALKVFKFADRMFTNTARTHYKQARDGTRHYQRFSFLQETFENKNKKRHLKAQLAERMESLGHSIKATRRCLADIQAEKTKQSDALQHCYWRLQQRSQRPPREQVQDGLEVSLEAQQEALTRVQDRLRYQEEECAKALMKLEDYLEQLTKDNAIMRKKNPVPDEQTGSKPGSPSPMVSLMDKANAVGAELLSFMNMEDLSLRQLWQVMDDNGNGRVTVDEFTDGIRMMNFCDEDNENRSTVACNSLFNGIDEDMTGSLSWKELQQFFDDLLDTLRKTHPVGKALLAYLQDKEWPLRQLWNYIDDGTDGRVVLDEFLRGMEKSGFLNNELDHHDVPGCTQFFHAIDQDRTGVMSWHEFQSYFAELTKLTQDADTGRNFIRELARKLAVANTVEREAKWMREESQDAMRSSSIDGGFAQRRVQAEMKKGIQITSSLVKRLQFLVSEAESRIRLHTWRSTWKDHAEVVQVTAKKRTARKYFTENADPIGAAEDLENQKDVEPLDVLDEAVQALKADLADKSAALAIDERCKNSRIIDGQVQILQVEVSPKNGQYTGLALPAPNPARPAGRAKSTPISARRSSNSSSGSAYRQPSKGSGFGSSARAGPAATADTPGPGHYPAEQSQAAWSIPPRSWN